MRLYVSVQRHRLPATNVVWATPANTSAHAYTISRLLEDVNAILPLEADNWGLEDYVVEVNGFECLHFSPVAQLLKDDDHVSIRPLQTAEVRARTVTGRIQISEGGEHLLDGVRFGRPLLRPGAPPRRPPVRIPAAPRPRPELEETEQMQLIISNGGPAAPQRKSRKSTKTVRFGELLQELDSEDEDEEDDGDFAPDEDKEDSDVDMDSSDEDSSSDESDASTGSAEALRKAHVADAEKNILLQQAMDGLGDSSSDSDTDTDSSSGSDTTTDSDSDSDSDSDESAGPDVIKFKDAAANHAPVPPGKGLKVTKGRNVRRKQSKKLNRLKEAGVLGPDAKLEDLRKWEERHGESEESTAPAPDTSSNKRKRADEPEKPNQVGVEDGTTSKSKSQKLMTEPLEETEGTVKQLLERKRLRPDTAAINRILQHQTRASCIPPIICSASSNLTQPLKKPTPNAKPAPVEEAPVDPDFWKSRINLSAFECWHEGYELSAPPYPFEQHWDPASQIMQTKDKKKQKKARQQANKQSMESAAQATPNDGPSAREQEVEEVNRDTEKLDYGDEPEVDADAAIESQLLQDVATAAPASKSKPDLPPLPENLESLPVLSRTDIAVGAVVVFKHYTMNPKNMNPEISSFKTAVVYDEGDSGSGAGVIGLALAQRDREQRPQKKFDTNGKRVYDNKAEGLRMDEDDEDEGLMDVQFYELLEARLLRPAPGKAEKAEVHVDANMDVDDAVVAQVIAP